MNDDEVVSIMSKLRASVGSKIKDKTVEESISILEELEDSDPVGSWQDMLANPENFLEENASDL
jgi:hypothetical protein